MALVKLTLRDDPWLLRAGTTKVAERVQLAPQHGDTRAQGARMIQSAQ